MSKEAQADNIWRGVLSHGTSVSDGKKHRIIEATIRLIAEEGIETVTFENIGNLLKTTKANIKYHFSDKDDLIFTAGRLVVTNAQAMTAAMVERHPEPELKLKAIVDGAYDWYLKFPEHVKVWALFIYYAQIHEPYARFFHETRAVGQSRMQLLLRALPGEHKDADYQALAAGIQNLIYGQLIAIGGRVKELKGSKAETAEIISAMLGAKGIKWSV